MVTKAIEKPTKDGNFVMNPTPPTKKAVSAQRKPKTLLVNEIKQI